MKENKEIPAASETSGSAATLKITVCGENDISDALEVVASAKRTPFTHWDSEYPGEENLLSDVRDGFLLICRDAASGEPLGVVAGNNVDAVDSDGSTVMDLPCWSKKMKNPVFICRLGVKESAQHRGVAKALILRGLEEAASRGFDGIIFFADDDNVPALRVYDGMGFRRCGRTDRWGEHFICYERVF